MAPISDPALEQRRFLFYAPHTGQFFTSWVSERFARQCAQTQPQLIVMDLSAAAGW